MATEKKGNAVVLAGNSLQKTEYINIMTEPPEIINTLQREFAQMPQVSGELQKGSVNDPSVILRRRHFFYKFVSRKVLTRLFWFFDLSAE